MSQTYSHADLNLTPPNPLYFRYQQMLANTQCSIHQHPWGQICRISLGIMEISLEQQELITPANFLVWIPAHTPHAAYVRQALDYTSIYVSGELAQLLPQETCLLAQTPLISALISDFCQRQVSHMQNASDHHQAKLLITRLSQCERTANFLPSSQDRLLLPILNTLQAEPNNDRSLASWAKEVHSLSLIHY